MSLAIYAAPFNGDSNYDDNNNNIIQRKKTSHNRTQKNNTREPIQTQKVANVLQTIQNTIGTSDSEDGNSLGDYYANPPPQPKSIGAERASTREHFQNAAGNATVPVPNEYNDNMDLHQYNTNYLDNINANEYYKKFIPNYTPAAIPPKMQNGYPYPTTQTPYYAANGVPGQPSGMAPQGDVLVQKLNYMINLLEEKQDEKTNNVTEEVVLYSFLGIFIIFIVDSFTRVGRYTR